MIRTLKKKPAIFKEAKDDLIFLELLYKEDVYGYVALEHLNEFISIHMESVKWTHNIAKNLKIDWEEIKIICKCMGAKEIVASNDNADDKRWFKFIKMYGFPKPKPILVSRQEI